MKYEEKKIAILNVGINSDHKIILPKGRKFPEIKEDLSFTFIPLPYQCDRKDCPNYKNLKSDIDHFVETTCYNPNKSNYRTYEDLKLRNFVRNENTFVHNDPEFITYTYGGDFYLSRSSGLRKIQKNDFLAFFASFQRYDIEQGGNFYFIGLFQIQKIFLLDDYEYPYNIPEIEKNEHIRNKRENSGVAIWKGSHNSILFNKAVRFDRKLAKKIIALIEFDTEDKSRKIRTDFEIINSKTRTSRLISEKGKKYFWKEVFKHNPSIKHHFGD
ncbi:MAG: hypothetical protein HeimC3_53130 [Candidatus Heimdallarchaeota archaeon LC_3]|nr:MAG: hypothetical protein HeimC3_53130 [Candidatus Heimdallarchaeota archaeon LC_3]